MSDSRNVQTPSSFGTVTISVQANTTLTSTRDPSHSLVARRCRYTWRPAPSVQARLPDGFEIGFDSLAGPDGVRRFSPAGGTECFLIRAALAGAALLEEEGQPTAQQCYSRHALRLFFQLAPRLREHLERRFNREQDLWIARPGRIGQESAHVLPGSLGCDGAGNGTAWGPGKVVEQGRAAANAAGLVDANVEDCIRLGLLEAARLSPIDPAALTGTQARALVRLALFDLGPCPDPVAAETADRVEERLLRALHRHLDDSTADFGHWFFQNIDDLVHQAAKQKRGGGPISREIVRQVLLEIVFRAFCDVGLCVHALAQAFSDGLPEPLTGPERDLFSWVYFQQPVLGCLPLLVLQTRFPFLREAILEVWASPGQSRSTGVLLRMLQIYGEMAAKRRESDRRYKRQSLHRNNDNRSARTLDLETCDSRPTSARQQFEDIARDILERRGALCKCHTLQYWSARVDEEKSSESTVLVASCEQCGHQEEFRVTLQELQKAAEACREPARVRRK